VRYVQLTQIESVFRAFDFGILNWPTSAP
jgi:hypothetical protein